MTSTMTTELVFPSVPLYREMAIRMSALINCRAKNEENKWEDLHQYALNELAREFLPSGSGFDMGSKINLVQSTGEKLVFFTKFHHMNEHGYYDGWSSHTITVTASLIHGLNIEIESEYADKKHEEEYGWDNGDHIAESFNIALTTKVKWNKETERYMQSD